MSCLLPSCTCRVPSLAWCPGRGLRTRSEPEYAAESALDVVHEGYWQVAGRCLQVTLIESDQGSDIDD
jgi:hypothetical protein